MNLLQEFVPSLRWANQATLSLKRQLFRQEGEDLETLCNMIMRSDGEYSSLLIAERIVIAWSKLDEDGRVDFFKFLTRRYDIDLELLSQNIEAYRLDDNADALQAVLDSAEPERQELFRRINMTPGGTAALVKMREHLYHHRRDNPDFRKIELDLRHLFNSWFNRGFLILQTVDWTTPAHILEKIIAYEAVHAIPNWRELRRRLQPVDRHCFAFFHPAMGDDPLVFVEVALTNEMPSAIDSILAESREPVDPQRATHAIFYSISSCHPGLSGISFGNFLIKQVAMRLRQQYPQLKHFATLSPAPGFRRWITGNPNASEAMSALLAAESPPDQPIESALATRLKKLAAAYYLTAKAPGNTPADPVARFHLRNGARLEQINLFADGSDNGWQQSLGMMVNYVYDLATVEQNHEKFMREQAVAATGSIRKLAGS